jgi:hypothetical protein
MAKRKSTVIIIVGLCLLFAISRIGVFRHWERNIKPLGDAPRIEFPPEGMSQSAVENFLEGNFAIITNVRGLPTPVLRAFTENTGSRLLIANPGEQFEATDVISDSSLPRMRLIFAGVLNDKNFVHYEQGGYSHMFIIALFNMPSADGIKPFWRGYCDGPAHNIAELRSKIVTRECR